MEIESGVRKCAWVSFFKEWLQVRVEKELFSWRKGTVVFIVWVKHPSECIASMCSEFGCDPDPFVVFGKPAWSLSQPGKDPSKATHVLSVLYVKHVSISYSSSIRQWLAFASASTLTDGRNANRCISATSWSIACTCLDGRRCLFLLLSNQPFDRPCCSIQ